METSWFWNHSHCWTDFPLQVMPNSTYGKYLMLLFYIGQSGAVRSVVSFGKSAMGQSAGTIQIAQNCTKQYDKLFYLFFIDYYRINLH